ncbi:MAG: FG-GAP-like repeat-containing protein [Methylococcaceae bacterium]
MPPPVQLINPVFASPLTNPFDLTNVGAYASPTFADIDGDGDLDVLVGNSAGELLYFQNKGTATNPLFVAGSLTGLPSSAGTFTTPTFVDINGDTLLDIVVGEKDGTTVYFKNTGSDAQHPSFATTASLTGLSTVGSNAHPSFTDINGDGLLDAVVGNGDGNIFYFENTGDATHPSFTYISKTTVGGANISGLTSTGGYFAAPTFVDINGDGLVDVLIGSQDSNLRYYQNTGSGFSYVSSNPFGLDKGMPRGHLVSASLVDINGDGKLDAFVGTSDGNLLLFINEPVSSTQTVAHTTVTGGSTADTTVTEGGVTDSFAVVLNGQPTSDVTVTLDNTNQQVSTSVTSLTFTSANWNTPQYVTVTAVDDSVGEGAHTGVIKFTTSSSDSAFNGATPSNIVVHITDNDIAPHNPTFDVPPASTSNNPFGTITNPNPFGLSNKGSNATPTFVDINADGKLDAFVGDSKGDTLYFKNSGTASTPVFDTPVNADALGISSAGTYAAPAFADIDGDGDLDAFVGAGNGGISFFKNSGSASNPNFDTAVDASTLGLVNTALSVKPTFADLNGDGKLDAIIGVQSGDTLVYLNTGTVNTPEFGTPATNPYGLTHVSTDKYARPVFMDINGDTKLDALIGDGAGDTLLFLNKGTATTPDFSDTPITNPFGLGNVGSSATPTFADINADGKPDVFIGNKTGDLSFAYNDAIATVTASGSVNFTEAKDAASTPIAINSSLTVADTDNATLASATVSITTGYQSSEDVLSFSNDGSTMGNITGSFNSTTGVETLLSSDNTATLAQWQAALRAVKYVDNSNTPNIATRTISFIVNDGIVDSTAATSQINVTDTNDSPSVTVANSATSFTEDASATVLDSTITVSDPELNAIGNYNGATLTLARHGGASTDDVFSSAAFSSNNVVVSSTTIGAVTTNSAGTLVLTFNSSATQTLVNSALQQIAYKDSSHTPPALVTLDWTFNDGNTGKQPQGSGGALSTTASTTVNITAANDPHTGGVTIDNGTPQQGDTLTANTSTLADLDGLGTLNYQWKVDGSAITNATSSTYKLTQTEVGKAITVTVSYTDKGGTAESADSNTTNKVANVNDDPTGTVTISDANPYQGETLTASNTLADLDGLGTITYEWFADKTSLGTSDSYTLTANEASKVISVIAHYTDGFSYAESVSSSNTNAVTSVNPAITISPTTLQNTGEDGTTASYSIVLTTKVAQDVVLSFSSSDTTEGTVDTPTLTFTSANWDTPQTLTVRGVDDYLNDGTVPYTVTGSISTTDNNYNVLSITALQLANLDDGRDLPQNLKGDRGNTKPIYDVLTGIDGDDQLYGYTMSDTLSGGIGNDSLWGGYGNDKLYGGAGDDSLLGEAGADSLVGGTGSDSLDGGAGIDTLDGGAGSDTYYLGYFDRDIINDTGSASDTDSVYVPYQVTSYTLPSSIENGIIPQGTRTYTTLSAFGTVNANSDTLTGNASCNTLIGNEGNNLLSGGLGNDIISGGLGNDTFTGGAGIDSFMLIDALNTVATPNIDTITDFTSGSDVIMLSRAIFTAYPPTTLLNLNADMTFTGGTRVGLSANLLYNANSGVLSYDSDGADSASPVALAILGSNTHPANLGHDFVVFDNTK